MIEVSTLTKNFGDVKALDDISITIKSLRYMDC